jgi:hypothetical protein
MYIYIYIYVAVFELFSDECIPSRASRKFYLTAAGIRTRDLRIVIYKLAFMYEIGQNLTLKRGQFVYNI